MSRKTHKDYKKEYSDALLKLSSIQSRIMKRASQMAKIQPDVMITEGVRIPVSVMDSYKEYELYLNSQEYPDGDFATKAFLRIIKTIEDHNEARSNIRQARIEGFDQ